MPLFFAYGLSIDPDAMRSEVAGWQRVAPASLPNYAYTFSGRHPKYHCGTSTLVALTGATALGAAYELDEEQLRAIEAAAGPGYVLRRHPALVEGVPAEVTTVEAEQAAALSPPSAEYVERVRGGLLRLYHPAVVGPYLERALKRCAGELPVLCQSPSPEAFRDEYGCDFRRLFPWPATKTSAFGSAWAIVPPGSSTTPHSHDEEETFIVVRGLGRMSVDGRERDVATGDAIYLEPFSAHTITNRSASEPLEFLCIWWGGAPAAQPVHELAGG